MNLGWSFHLPRLTEVRAFAGRGVGDEAREWWIAGVHQDFVRAKLADGRLVSSTPALQGMFVR